MTFKTGERLCTDEDTKRTFRMIAAKLGIQINEAVRFAARYAYRNIKDFEKKAAAMKKAKK